MFVFAVLLRLCAIADTDEGPLAPVPGSSGARWCAMLREIGLLSQMLLACKHMRILQCIAGTSTSRCVAVEKLQVCHPDRHNYSRSLFHTNPLTTSKSLLGRQQHSTTGVKIRTIQREGLGDTLAGSAKSEPRPAFLVLCEFRALYAPFGRCLPILV